MAEKVWKGYTKKSDLRINFVVHLPIYQIRVLRVHFHGTSTTANCIVVIVFKNIEPSWCIFNSEIQFNYLICSITGRFSQAASFLIVAKAVCLETNEQTFRVPHRCTMHNCLAECGWIKTSIYYASHETIRMNIIAILMVWFLFPLAQPQRRAHYITSQAF